MHRRIQSIHHPLLRSIAVLIALGLMAAAQVRSSGQTPSELPAGVRVLRDIEYARAGERPLLLDLYLPEAQGERALPVIVWVHGGAWRAGSKNRTPAAPLAAQGYAVASISYRLSQEARFPAQIHDCKAAVRWLRANAKQYRLDPDRIGAWGPSAGGHLVALLGTSGGVKELEGDGGNAQYSSRVQAVCDWFGPTDFLQMDAHAPAGATQKHDAADSPESQLVGGPIQENRDKVAQANPITYVTADDPPFLILHGDRDALVPIHQSQLLYEALKRAGVEATFHPLKGAGHGGPGFDAPEVRRMVEGFFERHLKNAKSKAASGQPR